MDTLVRLASPTAAHQPAVVAASVLDCQTASSPPSGVTGTQGCRVQLEQSAVGGGGGGGSQTQSQPPAAVFNTLSFLGSFSSVSQTTTGDERRASRIKLFKDA